MKTEKEINSRIIDISMKIYQQFPELLKYINEIQYSISDVNTGFIDSDNLMEYCDSLEELITTYSKTHIRSVEMHYTVHYFISPPLNAPLMGICLKINQKYFDLNSERGFKS